VSVVVGIWRLNCSVVGRISCNVSPHSFAKPLQPAPAELAELWEQNRIRLRTLSRSNQKTQPSPVYQHIHNTIRQLIETVNGQLSDQFAIEKNYAHTFWGLCTRLISKLTAHTLCMYINRLLGKPDFLQIKALAFPN
jgi:hypothetical protein